VIAQTVQGHLLLGHQLYGALVHLGVMDADTAKNGKRLEQRNVRLVEGRSIVLHNMWEKETKKQ
jgi:hypothetical protein